MNYVYAEDWCGERALLADAGSGGRETLDFRCLNVPHLKFHEDDLMPLCSRRSDSDEFAPAVLTVLAFAWGAAARPDFMMERRD